MEERKLISININGLNIPNKRRETFHKLEKMKLDIICLQETHIKKQHKYLLQQPKLGKLFSTSADKKKRGVVLYIKDFLSPELKFTDDDGRVIMVEIMQNKVKTLLVAIYAPNSKQEEFYKKLYLQIIKLDYASLCIMGDFNGIMNSKMDYKTQTGNTSRKILPKSLFQMMEELNLQDVWRVKNMKNRQYTFYSNRHKSWSRIDMILISAEQMVNVQHCNIEISSWADHNPIKMEWRGYQKKPRWTLNNNILKEEKFKTKMEKEIDFYFQENKKEDTSIQTRWDAFKAYTRGQVISYTRKRNLQENLCYKNLEKEYKELEQELQKSPQKRENKMKMDIIKHKMALKGKKELALKIRNAKQNYFEHANKPGRWLAYKIGKEKQAKNINQLMDEQGQECFENEGKKKIVQDFYKRLYKQEKISEEKIIQYLQQIKLPQISKETETMLDERITMMELQQAIQKQNIGKTPGTDGLPAEFYKMFENNLGLQLLELMNEALIKKTIPQTWTEALITLIPKEGADHQHISNYRPISLLNSDYKIFATILAERLKKYLNQFIHSDQNGFLQHRQIKNNIRIILDTLEYYEAHPEKQMALMFLDAQKAFDNVNWRFLIIQMEQMGFGPKFVQAIEAIYTKQTARVMINGELTSEFNITKGTRQGCPLSPLLFILTIEVLTRNIRDDKEIKGMTIRKEEYKLQAFADDLVFILEEPLQSIEKLLRTIEEYGEVAGLKINRDKTKILTKNIQIKHKDEIEEKTGIQIVKKIKYLGINITARCGSLKEDNYYKIKQQIITDLKKWQNLQLSLFGRISTIKMNILPKLLYLFQTIPIHLDKKFFIELDKVILKFIWQGRKARIKMRLLQDARLRGGLALPNFELYYQAASLLWIKEWITLDNVRLLTLEGHDLLLGWHAFLWYGGAKKYGSFRAHSIRQALLSNWLKVKKRHYLKIPRWISTIEAFSYSLIHKKEQTVRYNEILNERGELKTMEEMKKQNIHMNWFAYYQIKMRYDKDLLEEIYEKPTDLDKILLGPDTKMITKLYNYLLQVDLEGEQVKETMIAWGQNFGYGITLAKWEQLWTQNYKMTMSTAYKENLYKMFYRWHLSPSRIARMSTNKSEKCWKCRQSPGSYYHMWWTCVEAKRFWTKIHNWLEKMIKEHIDLKPEIFLLGMIPDSYTKEIKYLLVNILTAARITFAKNWKNEKIPLQEEVIKKTWECAEMSKLTFEIKEQDDNDFYRIWAVFYQWIEKEL